MRLHSAAIAIFLVFFFESSVLGQWIPRIPDIKTALALSDASLGLALLALPLGTVLGFAIVGKIIESYGLRTCCRWFLVVWALLFIGPALAGNFWQLFLALFVAGVAVGTIETAMNTEAARIERVLGIRIMSRCHGFWSLGTMFGALMGGALSQWGVSVFTHFLIAMPILAVCGFIVAGFLPESSTSGSDIPSKNNKELSPDAGENSKLFRWPSRSILLLCLMPIGIMMVEGAFIDWCCFHAGHYVCGAHHYCNHLFSVFSGDGISAIVWRSSSYPIRRFMDHQSIWNRNYHWYYGLCPSARYSLGFFCCCDCRRRGCYSISIGCYRCGQSTE